MEIINRLFQNLKQRIRIEKPVIQTQEEDQLWREVQRYVEMIPGEADPHMGRVEEIKEEIRSGNYPTREMIDAAAARLASRLRKQPFSDQQQ